MDPKSRYTASVSSNIKKTGSYTQDDGHCIFKRRFSHCAVGTFPRKREVLKGYYYLKIFAVVEVVAWIKLKDELVVDPGLCPDIHVDAKETCKQDSQEQSSVNE